MYAFRFLRVSLSLQAAESQHELLAALHHLRTISSLAEQQNDVAIVITCATLEAMIHLRSGSSDSVEQVQRAIASARTHQLKPSVVDLTHVWALVDFIDLSCSLLQSDPDQAWTKTAKVQQFMDGLMESSSWSDDGSFAIPLARPGGTLLETTNGIFQKSKNGTDCVVFAWLNKRDLYTLSFLLSGIASQLKNATDHKSERYFNEGDKMVKGNEFSFWIVTTLAHDYQLENFDPKNLTVPEITLASSSLPTAAYRLQRWSHTQWQLHLHLAFLRCNRTDWNAARTHLNALLEMPQDGDSKTLGHRRRWTTYLAGVIEQGSGNLDAALAAFQDPSLALPTAPTTRAFDSQNDLRLLAALNTLLIISSPSHQQHHLAESIMVTLETLILPHPNQHPNKAIVSSIFLLKSILGNLLTNKKQYLQTALNNARSLNNAQLLAVAMNALTSMFFKDIVGSQTDKSSATAMVLSKRAESNLWRAVANGLMANTMEMQGKAREAENAKQEAERLVESLPEGVRNSLLNE
jgi:hypothetical protein